MRSRPVCSQLVQTSGPPESSRTLNEECSMTTVTAETTEKRGIPGLAQLQRIGRSLMLPIASLPAAALLLRLGQDDMLGKDGLGATVEWMLPVAAVLAAAGNALFANLAMLFALGVAVGYARKSDGSTALAALIGYLVFKGVTDALSPYILGEAAKGEKQGVTNGGLRGGWVMGRLAAPLSKKSPGTKPPPYLAFFGGRRFVPIVTAGAAILIGVAAALIYPVFDAGF